MGFSVNIFVTVFVFFLSVICLKQVFSAELGYVFMYSLNPHFGLARRQLPQ